MNEQRHGKAGELPLTAEEKAGLCIGADFWHVRGVPRLGLKGIMVADGPHGLRKQVANHDSARPSDSVPAVCFPTASAVACTFDEELAYAMGRAMGEECRREGVSVLLGPGVNLKRSPLGGRNFEYFSEDPYLAGKLAAAMIRGIQSTGVGASLKHFAVNSQETERLTVDEVVDERALREVYLRPFEIAVQEGKPWTVMAAYNRLNGTYCCENKELLDLLRREWGFDGLVMSDWGAVNDVQRAMDAGMDLEMPGISNGHREVLAAGKTPALDRGAEKVLQLLGRAEQGAQRPYACDFAAHHALAETIAASAAVLLKNDGLLPGRRGQRAAVIGALAGEPRCQGSGSSRIHPWRLDSPWEALCKELPDAVYVPGYDLAAEESQSEQIAQALEAVRGKDIVYLFAGLPESWECEGFDRTHLRLPAGQEALIEAVCRENPRTVVILLSGGALELPWADRPGAILLAHLGGEAVGTAVAKLLLGDLSPSGKLAETFPLSLADTPPAGCYPARHVAQHRESLYVGYRYYDAAGKAVRYPFGHGLSYARFAYSGLSVQRAGEQLVVRCRIENVGSMTAAETVQLYLAPPRKVAFAPPQILTGFARRTLAPGEAAEITFTLTRRDVSYYSPAGKCWKVEGGVYELRLGASSRDIRLRAAIEWPGDDVCPADAANWATCPHYAKVDGVFPKEEFERLLGWAVPCYRPPQKGEYTLNTMPEELASCRAGRALLCGIRCFLRWRCRRDVRREARAWALVTQSPLRQAVQGGVPLWLIRLLLRLCNGRRRAVQKK